MRKTHGSVFTFFGFPFKAFGASASLLCGKAVCHFSEVMKIRILCVGKIKEKYFKDAVSEYRKRLTRYCSLEICESSDEKTPEGASVHEEDLIREKEGERILGNIREGDYVIALSITGKKYSSENLSSHLESLMNHGKSTIDLVIGGSLGLGKNVLSRADEEISFSDLTFPHQLMRVILLEQVYRSFRIMRHEPYHK